MEIALVSIVMEKLGKPLVSMAIKKLEKEVKLIVGAKVELTKLSSTFKSIQAVLNHAETMQITDKSVRVWIEKLKDVAYDMEDVLDELILSAEETEPGTDVGNHPRFGNQVWACLFSLFSCCGLEDLIGLARESWTNGDQTDFVTTFLSKVESQRDLAHQIKEIKERLDQIAAEKDTYSFGENSSRGDNDLDKAEFQTSSFVDESQMLGRDEDKNIIISKLISESSREEGRIHVVSIVGVGGLGKTTLAQLICNDERVTSHFHKVLWVCVSNDFNVINLTKAIIEAAGGTKPPHSQLDSLQKQLIQTLQDKLFLLVLDDVWNDERESWERLRPSFRSGAPGSKILVTTRSEKVANTCMPSAYKHKLEGLSDHDCWLLFSSRAFARREIEDCPKLKKIGKKIVKKCKGVPLSAKVIGSAMPSKTSTQDWQNILESQTWEIRGIAKGILPTLVLSYYNLPLHLKPCFAYCSIFPKDHLLRKDTLVQLWLAQGFIKPEGKREMEEIGGQNFDELLAWSLLQDAYVDNEGVTKCKMHHFLHDLIQFITKNECCIFENGKTDSSSVTVLRHSSFISTRETPHIPAPLCHAKKLRTLLQIGYSEIDTIPDNLSCYAKSLRVLDFGGTGTSMKELPSSIGLLKHLRFLDLSYSWIVELPESVSNLRNLQTLKLNFCKELERLPSRMSAMVCLRHLEMKGTVKLKYLPKGLGRISSLRTLSRFIVGGHDGGCKIGDLKLLDSLQGKLEIEHLERVVSVDEAKEAELKNKLHLLVLSLIMSPDDALEMSGNGEVERMENVVEALRLPFANLEELEILGYIGSKFPTWIGDSSFSNLVKLKLIDCNNCTQLPGLGRLPSLEYLEIAAGLVKLVGSEFYGNGCGGCINQASFPKLKHLEFWKMYALEVWELRLEDSEIMPSLHSLTIRNCPKLKALPTHLRKSLTSLNIYNLNSMTSLAYGWKQLESIKSLTIGVCYKLKSLPDELGQLKSLRSLEIRRCPELQSLPKGLWDLTCLQDLKIVGNRMLADECKKKYRSKASGIPNIWIDGKRIK
ncbi:disease resistance protein RGA2-like [Magnolia sinica]|uniref:disease resistance protein RGA2-like n=1 Tax=Magnolia sinica TaxID=86752 RepID=UPI00265ABB9B|nr:disease resistance protein RGA2-like [Magnolia sinica]